MSAGPTLILYALFALGGLGLYFAMPRLQHRTAVVGAIFGLAALAGLLAFLGGQFMGPPLGSRFYFYLFAMIAVLAAARVITHAKPVYSAIYVVALVIAVAAMLVLQQAEFLAVALIIIYAGAILVTYLFVIMLAQQPGAPVYDRQAREPFTATIAGFVLTGLVAGAAAQSVPVSSTAGTPLSMPESPLGHTFAIGATLMTKYIVALEIAGVLLLISMVGAIALSRKRVPAEFARSSAPLGEIGKHVEPF